MRLAQPVADAAQAFLKEYQNAYAAGKINKELSFLSSLKIVKGYTSIYSQYNTYIRSILNVFINTYLVKYEERYRGLTDISDFVDAFLDFNKEFKAANLLLSSFILSKDCDPHVSGLMFSIADLDAGADQIKYDDFINTKNSYFFRQIALKHGFNININMPWTLIADLESPGFNQYLSKYICASGNRGAVGEAVNATSKFFDNFYSVAYYQDIDLLKNQILRFYNIFVSERPNRITISDKECGKALSIFQRSQVSEDFINLSYDDSDWLQFYIDIKTAEFEDGILEPAKNNEIKRYALSLLQIYDLTRAIFYVNLEIQKKFSGRRGSFASVDSIVLEQAPETASTSYTTSPNEETITNDGIPSTLEDAGAEPIHVLGEYIDGGITPLGEEFSNEEEF